MKIKILILIFVLAFTIIGCNPQPVSIENVYVCESLEGEGALDRDPEPFPAGIDNIYLSVEVSNISTEDELEVIWTFLDTGNIIDQQLSVVEQDGSGYLNFNIYISEGFPSGNYRADVYLNGELVEELDFSVQ